MNVKNIRSTFFYRLVESQNNPAKSPLIFFLGGGPGGSSLMELFTSNGPYFIGPELKRNQNSWNTGANVVYVESPIGVGFTYGLSQKDHEYSNELVKIIFLKFLRLIYIVS